MLRPLIRSGSSLLLACVASFTPLSVLNAGTFTWANVTGTWSTPGNWTPAGAPTGTDPTDVLIFGGDVGSVAGSAPNYTSTNDLSGRFVLNGITLQATDLSGQPTDPPHLIAGNPLAFAGATANVTQNGAGPITFNTPISFSSGLTLAGNGTGAVTFNRGLSGSGDIIKSGTSAFRFGTFPILPATTAPSENTWMGTLVINGGTIRFNNNAESGRTALRANGVTLTPGTTLNSTSQLRVGTLAGTGGSVESRVTASNSDNEDIVITALDSGTFSGTLLLAAPTGTGNDTGALTVRGPGVQVLNGTLNIEKDVAVAGSLVFSGTASLGTQQKGAIIMQGGTLRLDNVVTNNPDRLRDAPSSGSSLTGIDVIGGGVFTLDGNATAGTSETVGRLQLSALAGGTPRTRPRSGHLLFDLVHRGGTTALTLQSYNRDATTAPPLNTTEFAARDGSGAILELGQSGNAPRVFFNTLPALINSLLPSTAGSNQTGWAVVRTATGLAFATHGATGIVPVPTTTTWASSTAAHIEVASSQNAFGSTFSAASIRLFPTASGQQITINSATLLNTPGIILTGGQDFEIAGPGTLAGTSPRFIHVDSGTLRVSAGIGTTQSIAKSGAGTLVLANTGNSGNQQPIAINQGALRVRLSPSTVPNGELQFRGGVLEIEGGGSFNRALVTLNQVAGPVTVNWSGSELVGSPAVATNLAEDRGSGGFAAVGGNATVDLGAVGASIVRWEDRSFLQSGYALVLGSGSADSTITLIDNFSLTSTEATVTYNAREIRVLDNSASAADRGVLSGAISGTIHNDLLKTGPGTLELTGTSTFVGAAIIREGTLAVNGSIAQSIVADVRSGGTLSGSGTVSAIILEGGGILAPGNTGVGTMTGASLTWRANGTARFDLGSTTSDKVNLGTGAFLRGSDAGPFTFDFAGSGSLGQSYTLVSFAATNFGAADFTATNLAPGVTGSFQISGGNLLFVTDAPPAPDVVTGNASNLGASTATVDGTVNPRGATTTARFEYGTTVDYGSFVDVTPAPGAGIAAVPVTANLTGLQPGTLYHFRLVATNPGGTINGLDNTFTTSTTPGPVVVTGGSSSVSGTSATVSGAVNPNGSATTAFFEYGTTTQYGSTVPVTAPGSGNTPVIVSALLSNLQPGTLYHYRLVAVNGGGRVEGGDAAFTTTDSGGPAVTTTAPTNVSARVATLNGNLNPNSLPTTAFFEYGLTTAYGQTAPVADPGTGSAPVNVSANIIGLLPTTTYHYRLVAQNSGGTTSGEDVTFATLPQATTPEPANDSLFVTNQAVTINVLANDVNPASGDNTGLTFDGITVQPQFGAVSGEGTLTYTPSKQFPVGGDTFTYRVKNAAGQTAEAQVRVRSFSAVKGDFATTIEEAGPAVSDTGSLLVTLTNKGKCTAKLIWERQSYSIKSSISADGSCSLAIAAASGNLTVNFKLDVDGTAPGVITNSSGESYAFELTRAAADAEGTSISPGVYTAWLPGDATLPGTGYVVVSVNNKGKAKLSGELSDGQPFSDSSSLFGHHYVLDPLLYKSGKTFGGQLRSEIQVTGGQTLGSEAEWFKDSGIATARALEGEKFIAAGASGYSAIIAALGSPSVSLVLEGGNLPGTQIIPLTLSQKKVTVGTTTLEKLKVTLNTKQGTFSGSFSLGGQKTSFAGAFRASQTEGRGHISGPTPGSVRITATP